MENKKLAAAIERDNKREDAGMHGDDRQTCWTHQSWSKDCESEPFHTEPGITNKYPRPA